MNSGRALVLPSSHAVDDMVAEDIGNRNVAQNDPREGRPRVMIRMPLEDDDVVLTPVEDDAVVLTPVEDNAMQFNDADLILDEGIDLSGAQAEDIGEPSVGVNNMFSLLLRSLLETSPVTVRYLGPSLPRLSRMGLPQLHGRADDEDIVDE